MTTIVNALLWLGAYGLAWMVVVAIVNWPWLLLLAVAGLLSLVAVLTWADQRPQPPIAR